MKKIVTTILFMALVFSLTVMPANVAAAEYEIVNVPKVSGVAWFERMKVGVEEWAEETGHNAYQVGPSKADAALQVQIVEDLIAKGVDAITIVPFSVEPLEPVLKKAREAGIVVIGHEGSNLQNVDYDIEAFENGAYGAHFMDYLAELMDEEGDYAVSVGSLTSKSHNEWIDAAIARQKEQYPDMNLVTERIETYDDQSVAYEKARELIKTYPELKGMQSCASTTAPGAGLAIEELGLEDEISLVGTSLVSQSGQYLESGAVDLIGFWDPALAAKAMNEIAVRVLEGKEVGNGTDLGVEGYENLTTENGKILYGQAWVDVTAENMDEYDF